LNFLIAGRDTTAQALSWAFFCLSEHPEAEARAREEVIAVCRQEEVAYEDMPKLPYLQAVISESLRLYPSVPMEMKYASQDDTWPDGTFVPKGSSVNYNVYGIGRDRSIWGEDAEMFRPERWLEMQGRAPGNYEYPVFNAGSRECLGRRLAMVEMKACLAILLPQVSLRLAVPASTITTDAQLTIGMRSGLPCFVTRACATESTECMDTSPVP
jgi:fatty acid omega-hydroxylase